MMNYSLDRVLAGQLSIHAWWFDIRTADVYTFSGVCYPNLQMLNEDRKKKYELLDEQRAEDILSFFQGVAPSKVNGISNHH